MNHKSIHDKGFTLLELLVVMVIIGLMASMVAPRLSGSLSNLNTKTAARKVAASLRYIRSKAASEKKIYRTQFDMSARKFIVEKMHGYTTRVKELNAPADEPENIYTYTLPEGIFFKWSNSSIGKSDSETFSILFYPSGGSSGGEIIIGDAKGESYRINVDFITGNIRLAEM